MIERPFIVLKDYNSLKTHLRNGDISTDTNAIVFLKKERTIWTHGTMFGLDLSSATTDAPKLEDITSNLPLGQFIDELGDDVDSLISLINGNDGINAQIGRLTVRVNTNETNIERFGNRIQALEDAEEIRDHSKGLYSSVDLLPTTDCESGDWAIVDINGVWYIYYYQNNQWLSGEEYEKPSVNLTEYVSKEELENKHYLSSIPEEYALKTDIPLIDLDKYIRQSQLNNYVTHEQLENKDYVTSDDLTEAISGIEIPEPDQQDLSLYVTKQELQSEQYAKQTDLDTINYSVESLLQLISNQPNQTKHIILTESQYAALTTYERNVIYIVVPDGTNTGSVWAFGDTFPIILR